ncbi:hypothetical protein [Bizionia arctica]|uniref:DUF4890 domain-containing protein n=1 Tax=Bizionia arctica TaxID=1495645 RepID=A0A917GTI9_9FLAO|nr:hypothetical protein [Bizionia arctica]GGG56177.1 hypothetical protein GCM10010976_28770 [Bizionia arctica]
MKKLAFIALVFMVSFTNAQEKMQSKQKMQDYTPEEMAQIQTKQLTLDLDLSDTQQKQVEQIQLENAKERQVMQEKRGSENKEVASKNELSKEDKLQMKNDRLDHQIKMKKEMKSILTPEQYTKWEKMNEEKKEKHQKNMQHKKKASLGAQKQ